MRSSYIPLPDGDFPAQYHQNYRRPIRGFFIIFSGLLLIFFVVNFFSDNGGSKCGSRSEMDGPSLVLPDDSRLKNTVSPENVKPVSRGVLEGVSEKSHGVFSGLEVPSFPWNDAMLSWQRTAYHFQPEQNWMNDPNGPMFYKGWYHFFYQYNPNAAVWGDIVWGHAISIDLINWFHLPLAMTPDHWYDINGVWTGSATLLPDGQIIMLYTGSTNESIQVQNLAYPANLSDPLLINWVKYSGNPVLVPPPGIGGKDFRDPTTAWFTPDRKWRITIGSKINKTGISLVYDTEDFKKFDLVDGVLHGVSGTGMWECVDFYPVSKFGKNGLDTSNDGPEVKHVLKASMDDDRNDYYAIGSYDHTTGTWTPDDARIDVGYGLRYDYGNFYAAKTFYDQNKKRRVLWGWITEYDSESTDIKKGWASLQSVPRTVLFDHKTGSNLIQWPVEEVESLRTTLKEFNHVKIEAGSVVPLVVGHASQLDIIAEFEIGDKTLNRDKEESNGEEEYSCRTSGGTAQRSALGPFGFLVLADESLSEQTPIYFYIAKGSDGKLSTFFCSDQSRSSEAIDVDKQVYGSFVPVLKGETLTMRILVDHSIVESFAQGGRACITSRVYPTKAIKGWTKVFLFNNATNTSVTTSLKIWQLKPALIIPYSSDAAVHDVHNQISIFFVLILLFFFSG